ncbi:YbjQ family protein [Rhodosalinus sediminis]|uniref:UPF0145 protein DRV84_14410 n=2 Tax=Rhodosalinus sediminis TaxID=1940533 RepID=A0A3D9BKU9_9RHOB|nr:YbjQ family protein [Rhodosalinus sediminis]
MAKCAECGREIGLLNSYGPGGALCKKCNAERLKGPDTPAMQEKREREAAVEAVTLTTEAYPEGLKISERIEVVTAECAFGMNVFKDLFAGVRDIVGGRSEAVQKTLRDSRRVALYELKKEAFEVGADAVVGVDLDYVELVAAGNMVLLVASGTAVKLDHG